MINRLKKVRDFNLLIKYGRYVSGQFFTLKYVELAKNKDYFPKKAKPRTGGHRPSSAGEDPGWFVSQLKLAFVVGVKVSKSAVKRNRLKRQMREVVRLMIKDSRLKIGYYILIVAKKEALGAEYNDISGDIEKNLRRIGVIHF